MPRKPTVLQSEFPYSIGARCINKEWFGMPMERVWQIMSEQLYFLMHGFGFEIHQFVLMSNHFHLIASTPRSNLSESMQHFMKESSRQITKPVGRINQTYGGPHFRCILQNHHYFLNTYKYNSYNSVKAKICDRVENYKFSTLHGLLGKSRLLIPVEEDLTLFSDVARTLEWLNRPPKSEKHWEWVRRALRRSEFKLVKDPNSKLANELETALL